MAATSKTWGLCQGCGRGRNIKRYDDEGKLTWLCRDCKKGKEDEAEKEAYKQGGEQ